MELSETRSVQDGIDGGVRYELSDFSHESRPFEFGFTDELIHYFLLTNNK